MNRSSTVAWTGKRAKKNEGTDTAYGPACIDYSLRILFSYTRIMQTLPFLLNICLTSWPFVGWLTSNSRSSLQDRSYQLHIHMPAELGQSLLSGIFIHFWRFLWKNKWERVKNLRANNRTKFGMWGLLLVGTFAAKFGPPDRFWPRTKFSVTDHAVQVSHNTLLHSKVQGSHTYTVTILFCMLWWIDLWYGEVFSNSLPPLLQNVTVVIKAKWTDEL